MAHRVGLMGNPSDGFNGKTIAVTISNFWAEVTLVDSQTLVTCISLSTTVSGDMLSWSADPQWFSGFSPSSSQWSHRVWQSAGSVLYQQEGGVRENINEPNLKTALIIFMQTVLLPCEFAGIWEVCGCCRLHVRSSTSSAPNKGEISGAATVSWHILVIPLEAFLQQLFQRKIDFNLWMKENL